MNKEKKKRGRPRKVKQEEPIAEEKEVVKNDIIEKKEEIVEKNEEVIIEKPADKEPQKINPLQYSEPTITADVKIEEVKGSIDNPLIEEPILRDYTNIGTNQVTDIKEPVYPTPNIHSDSSIPPPQGADKKIENPAVVDLPPEEKKQAVENMADFAIALYEKLNALGYKLIEIKENKLLEMALRGEIELDAKIPTGENQFITVNEFVKDYNSQAEKIMVVSNEFKQSIKPPLMRILMRRNWGMSDEQTVILILVNDAAAKIAMMNQQFRQGKDIIATMKEMTEELKKARKAPKNNEVEFEEIKKETEFHEPEETNIAE